jgi:T-complex protein 1 subunit eta
MIASASEAACLILSVDETVKNPGAEQPGQEPVRGRGRGRGRR